MQSGFRLYSARWGYDRYLAMRLVTFQEAGRVRIGALLGDRVLDFSAADAGVPIDMRVFLEAGTAAMKTAAALVAAGETHLDLAQVHLQAPVLRPPKILAIGLNYRKHAEEAGRDIPTVPVMFNKQSLSAHPPYDPVERPLDSNLLDYEGELGFVIGRRCRRVAATEAADVIAGYCVVNDVSVRDWQMASNPVSMTMGKSTDTHCPFGPAIVTADEFPDPHQLQLRTLVNGEERQNTSTNDLIFNCFDIVEFFSRAFTLEPGDLIVTGTPSGVGAFWGEGGAWLVPGDRVRVEIEHLGHIENEVCQEQAVS